MRKFLVAVGAFLLATIVIVALAQSHRPSSGSTPQRQGAQTSTMATSGMMGTAKVAARDVNLAILHVRRGCHVWRDGPKMGPVMSLTIERGGLLSIVDQDVDAHQLVQVAGPRLHMPGPMRMMGRARLTFMRPGTYRLATKLVDLPGSSMTDAPTIGPDNHLRLTVTVT